MRAFSYPEVTTLPVGGSCVVNATVSEVKRKCSLYGLRNNKRFNVTFVANMDAGPVGVEVTRLPVTDTELPGAQ